MHNQLNNSPSEFQTMEVEASNQAIVELSPEEMEQATGGVAVQMGKVSGAVSNVLGYAYKGAHKLGNVLGRSAH